MFKRKIPLVISLVLLVLVAVVFFFSGRLSAPEPTNNQEEQTSIYKDGDRVTLTGEFVCLPHKNTDGPQTLECAYGLKVGSDLYYAVKDTTSDYSLISKVAMGKPVHIEGTFRNSSSDSIYQESGTIEITSVAE